MTRRSLSDITAPAEDGQAPPQIPARPEAAAPADPARPRRRRAARQDAPAAAKPAGQRPTARDLTAPARPAIAREALKADVPADLALLQRLRRYRLDKGVDIRDQVAIAVDEWLTREGY
jgi:hypothetical protein